MEKLVGDVLAHESWDEYADHSLTHDDVVVVKKPDVPVEPRFDSDRWWVSL